MTFRLVGVQPDGTQDLIERSMSADELCSQLRNWRRFEPGYAALRWESEQRSAALPAGADGVSSSELAVFWPGDVDWRW